MKKESTWGPVNCPLPAADRERVTLAQGEGARATRDFIHQQILSRFVGEPLSRLGDAALLTAAEQRLAMTTDSFVVTPMFFPGGDIGSLAVYGTVNDLAVSGAEPRWLSLALMIEEGLPLSDLHRILDSAAKAAEHCGVQVVTGDTKVVPRGAVDGLFINTTGIGEFGQNPPIGPSALGVGDTLIVSGPIGCHGLAVLTAREELLLEPSPQSDSAPLHRAAAQLQAAGGESIRAMRDATRGGLSAVLHEWSEASGLTMALQEQQIPVREDVRGACELLGIDPLHSACEGTMVIAVAASFADEALAVLQSLPETGAAACVGAVAPAGLAPVTIQRLLGTAQPVDEPTGVQLPRIC